MSTCLPGVLQIVVGDDDAGRGDGQPSRAAQGELHRLDRGGKAVASAAGADLKRATLELGGNDAAILLDDVDTGEIAPAVLARAFFNAGQTCAIPKRIYAP